MEFTPLTQSDEFARTLRLMRRDCVTINLTAPGGTATALLVRLPMGGWACSRGPVWRGVWQPHEKCRAIMDLRAAGARIINPMDADADVMAQAGYARIITPATSAIVPCRADWLDHAHGKWRNALRRAQAQWPQTGLHLNRNAYRPETGGWLLRACQGQARMRHYKDWPIHFIQSFAQANPNAAQVFSARIGHAPVAGLMILTHGGGASYHCAWANDRGKAAGASRLLLNAAMNWLQRKNCAALDLGVLDTQANPSLARFKLGMGAVAHPHGGTWIKLPFARQKRRTITGAAA